MITNEFSKYHPISNLIYFVLFFVSLFVINNPFAVLILLTAAVFFNIILDRGKTLKSKIFFYIFIALIIFIFNPLFSHKGAIILFYMFGNPVTLESVVFGLRSSLSLVTVLVVFNAFNIIINPEKFNYLFSRMAKQTAFVVMLGLRFVPTLKRRMMEISDIAKISKSNSGLSRKLKDSMNIILTLIMWSLEDAVVTAQSMRSRGYGVNIKSKNGRTFYFLYKFTKRDVLFIFFNITSFGLCLFTFLKYDVDFYIYPTFSSFDSIISTASLINILFLTIQVMLPIFAEIINRIKWSFKYNADNRI